MKAIISADNPAYRGWLRLAEQGRAQRVQQRTLAEGIHLAQAALAADVAVEAYLLRRGADAAHGELAALLATLAARRLPGYTLAAPLYDRLAPVERGAGLLLLIGTRSAPLPVASRADLVYLDRVQDPGNIGTLLRIAAAAGIGHVLGGSGCAAFWSPKALRAGMGAQFRLHLTEGVDAALLPVALQGDWIACEAHDAQALWSAPLAPGAIGWVFGSEGGGIAAATAAACRQRVRVPLAPGVESLNVAAAAAVCLFERCRRRAASAAQPQPAAPDQAAVS